MSEDQLALFDPPPREVPDCRPPCAACGDPALANVYGFAWYAPRKSFVGTGREGAKPSCRAHLEQVTAEVKAYALTLDRGLELVWSLIHQPGNPDARLPGTEFAWYEVERQDP